MTESIDARALLDMLEESAQFQTHSWDVIF